MLKKNLRIKPPLYLLPVLVLAALLAACPGPLDPEPPEQPVIISVVPGDQSLTVTWQESAKADSYELYYDDENTPPGTEVSASITNATGTTHTITSLDNGTTYHVWVRAKNSVGVSEYSAPNSGTPRAAGTSGLTLPEGTYKSAALPPDAGGYGNDWYTIENGTIAYYYEGAQTFSGQGVSYNNDVVIVKITATSEYGPTVDKYYGVYIGDVTPFSFTGANAYKASGNNTGMNTLDEAVAEYAKDSGYFPVEYRAGYGRYAGTATVTGIATSLEVTWTAVPDADGYDVYYTDTTIPPTSTTSAITATVTITETTAVITGLTNDTAYKVWVRAKNSSKTGAWVYQGSGTPEALVFPIAGYFKGDYIPWDDGIGITASHFYQYDDGALGISYGGDIIKHIPAGTDGKAGTIIIKITEAGTWEKTVGSYYAVDYKNYGYSTSMEVVRIQTSSATKTGGENNNGVSTLAEAITEYTVDNGYFSLYGNYRQFRDEIPQTDSSLTLTGLTGAWSGTDGDDMDYFIRIANPVLTWSSDLGYNTASHQFAGTIVETTAAAESSGYIYIKVDFVNTRNGDYDDLKIGNYFAIHWKDKANGGIKLCAAYGTDTDGTATLTEAKTTYTVANNYFDDDYYVVITPPSP